MYIPHEMCAFFPAVRATPAAGVACAEGHSLAVAAGVTLRDPDWHKSEWE